MSSGATLTTRLQIRRGTSADWFSENPILGRGEPAYDATKKLLKIGDGINTWQNLPYQAVDYKGQMPLGGNQLVSVGEIWENGDGKPFIALSKFFTAVNPVAGPFWMEYEFVTQKQLRLYSGATVNVQANIFQLPELLVTQDGAQQFGLPSSAVGVLDLNAYNPSGTDAWVQPLYQKDYYVSGGTLYVSADAGLKSGDRLEGSYYAAGMGDQTILYSGTGQNTDGAITQKGTTNALALKADLVGGIVPLNQLPPLTDPRITDWVLEVNEVAVIDNSLEIQVNTDYNKRYALRNSYIYAIGGGVPANSPVAPVIGSLVTFRQVENMGPSQVYLLDRDYFPLPLPQTTYILQAGESVTFRIVAGPQYFQKVEHIKLPRITAWATGTRFYAGQTVFTTAGKYFRVKNDHVTLATQVAPTVSTTVYEPIGYTLPGGAGFQQVLVSDGGSGSMWRNGSELPLYNFTSSITTFGTISASYTTNQAIALLERRSLINTSNYIRYINTRGWEAKDTLSAGLSGLAEGQTVYQQLGFIQENGTITCDGAYINMRGNEMFFSGTIRMQGGRITDGYISRGIGLIQAAPGGVNQDVLIQNVRLDANLAVFANQILTLDRVTMAGGQSIVYAGRLVIQSNCDLGTVRLTPSGTTSQLVDRRGISSVSTPTILYSGTGQNTNGAMTQKAATDALNLKADLASPALTGLPTGPTAVYGANTTQLATTSFVQQEKGYRKIYDLGNNQVTSTSGRFSYFDGSYGGLLGASTTAGGPVVVGIPADIFMTQNGTAAPIGMFYYARQGATGSTITVAPVRFFIGDPVPTILFRNTSGTTSLYETLRIEKIANDTWLVTPAEGEIGTGSTSTPAVLYSGTGQNTDGAITQKGVTDIFSVKADLVGGIVPQSQLPYVQDIDDVHNNQAILVRKDRSRMYYTHIASGTTDAANDGVQKALAAATSGDTVYITTPLVQPYISSVSALFRIPIGANMNLNSFDVMCLDRQDGLFPQGGTGYVYGNNARIVNEGSYGVYTTSTSTATKYNFYAINLECITNTLTNRNGSGIFARADSKLYFEGTITSKSNGVGTAGAYAAVYATDTANVEFVGSVSCENGGIVSTTYSSSRVLFRNGRMRVIGASTANLGEIWGGSTVDIQRMTIELIARPATSGYRMLDPDGLCRLILTDVVVLTGAIVTNSNFNTIVLRGDTTLPAAYGVAYLQGLGMTVFDQRISNAPILYSGTGQNTNGAITQKGVTDLLSALPQPVLYPGTGQNVNGAMTQKAATDELNKRDAFQGSWNPNTNTPGLPVSGAGIARGSYWRVSANTVPSSSYTNSAKSNVPYDNYIQLYDSVPVQVGSIMTSSVPNSATLNIPAGTTVIGKGGSFTNPDVIVNTVCLIPTDTPLTFMYTTSFAGIVDFVVGDFLYWDGVTWSLRPGMGRVNTAFQTLPAGQATVTINAAGAVLYNAQLLLGLNVNLLITGAMDGASGTLIVNQNGGTSAWTITPPVGSLGFTQPSTTNLSVTVYTWINRSGTLYWTKIIY